MNIGARTAMWSGAKSVVDTRFRELVEGTITEIVDSSITRVNRFVCGRNGNLINVDLPNCTYIGEQGFIDTGVVRVNIPAIETLVGTCFQDCHSLEWLSDMPNLVYCGGYMFRNAKFPRLYAPKVTRIDNNLASGDSYLKDIYLGKLISGHINAFYNTGANVPTDENGVKTYIHVGNTCSEIMAVSGFPFDGFADTAIYKRFVCSDGYVQYIDGEWKAVIGGV